MFDIAHYNVDCADGYLQSHSDGEGYISIYIYPPKIRPGKFLWSKSDVLMVIDLIVYIIIPPQKSSTMSFENLNPPPKKKDFRLSPWLLVMEPLVLFFCAVH